MRIAKWIFIFSLLAGCINRPTPLAQDNISTSTPQLPTITFTPVLPTITFTPIPTQTPTPASRPEPLGCLKPPDDYRRVEVNGWVINQRTMAMLTYAQVLYGGELAITNTGITQGSYNNNVDASFGTHAGGGAVDLSVLRSGTYTVLWDDIGPLLNALRTAGFAAWLRDFGELYENSPIHIHAIAIGDQELSQAALDQLTGVSGYFRGYSGLTTPDGLPTKDRFGGPIICQWMIDLGYNDLH